MRRSFGLDVLACPRCGERMELISAIEDRVVIDRILAHLGLPARAPPRGHTWRSQRDLVLEGRTDVLDGVDQPSAFE